MRTATHGLRLVIIGGLILIAAALPACRRHGTLQDHFSDSGGSSGVFTVPPDSITITSAPGTPLAVGQRFQFAATARWGLLLLDVTTAAQWSSDDPALAVDSKGLGSAVAPGTALLQASLLGVDSPQLPVTAEAIASISVTPAAGAVTIGTTQQFTALATLTPSGAVVDATSAVLWSGSDPAVASLGPAAGLATGRTLGSVSVTAQDPANSGVWGTASLSVEGIASLAVTPTGRLLVPGATLQYKATATLAPSGASADATGAVTWSSDAPAVVSLGAGTGLATGIGEQLGVTVRAADPRAPGTFGTASVNAERIDAIDVVVNAGGAADVLVGGTLQLRADATLSLSGITDLTAQVGWSSSDSAVATVDSGGKVSGVADGTALISAAGPTPSGVAGHLTVNVYSAAFVDWVVEPAAQSLQVGTSLQYRLMKLYSDGTRVDASDRVTAWSTGSAAIASIGTDGTASAAGVGTTAVSAAFLDESGQPASRFTALTVVSADTTPPTVIGVSPPHLAGEVALNARPAAVFSEAMAPATLSGSTFTLSSPGGPVAGVVSYNSGLLLGTFTPTGPLSENTVYTATLAAGVTDLAGNPLGAPVSWSFTTVVDGTPPTILSVSPLPGTTNVPLDALVTATFSEPIPPPLLDSPASNVTLSDGSGPVAGTVSYAPGTRTVTFTPTGGLQGNQIYTATISTAVTDSAPTPNALASAQVWQFSTVPELYSLAVSPAAGAASPKGLTQAFTATGHYSNGSTQDLTAQVTWASSAPGVASIASSGLATALALGSTQITARLGSVTSPAVPYTVTAAQLLSLVVTSAATGDLVKGTTRQMTASGLYTDASTADLTAAVTWSSSNTSVATLSAAGLVTAGNTGGTTNLTAALGTVVSPAFALVVVDKTVTAFTIAGPASVVEGRSTSPFSVSAVTYSDGSTTPLPSVSWSVTAGSGAASVNAGTGVVTGGAPGTVTVTASEPASGLTRSLTLTVVAKTLTGMTIGGPSSIEEGLSTAAFTVTSASYDNGATMPLPTVAWSIVPGTGTATVNAGTGVVTGGTAGTVTVKATHAASGVTATQTLTVTAKTVTALTIAGASTVLEGASTPAFTVTAVTYSNGATTPIPAVVWSVAAGTGTATINAGTGVVTGGTPGTVTVKATHVASGTLSNVLTLTILAKTLTSMTIAGPSSVLEGLNTAAFAVTAATYDNGSTTPLPSVTWSVTPGTGTAVINVATGVLTGGTPGTVTVKATHVAAGVVSNVLTLTVQAKTLTALTIGGASTVLEGLATAPYGVATATYNNGTTTPLPSVTWSVTAGTGTATVNASTGVVTGGTPGTVTVTATHTPSGVTASLTLTVLAKTVTSLTIAGASSVLEGAATPAYTVSAVTYSNGATTPIPAVTWSVAAGTGTATVNAATGVVTGGTPGTVTVKATHVASGTLSNVLTLTVVAKTLTSLTISGAATVVEGLSTPAYTVSAATYDNGSTTPLPSVTWSVTPGTGTATINAATGVVTGGMPGTVTVKATHVASGVVSNLLTLTVQAKTLTALTIGGASSVLEGVATAPYGVATATYNNGSTTPLPTVTWSVTAGSGTATVNASTGVVTGGTAGTVTVTATHAASGVTASLTLTVVAKTVTGLTIAGASSVLEGVTTPAYTVSAVTYDNGATSPLPTVSWSVTNGTGTATVNAGTGVVTGGTPGTVTVKATHAASGVVSNAITLTVQAKTLTSLTISGAATVVEGMNTAAYAVTAASYDNGSATPLPSVTWSVTAGTGTATVNAGTGVVTGGTPGTVTVQATHVASGVVSNSVVLTVQAKTLTALTISGASTVVEGNSTAAFTVAGATYNNGTSTPVPTVSWSVTNGTGTASVNAGTGVVTGGTPGSVTVTATHAASGVNASQGVTVLAKSVTGLTSAGASTVVEGLNTAAYTVTAVIYDNGTTSPIPTVTWGVTAGTGTASINASTGVVTGGAPGTVTVRATHVASGTVSNAITLTVQAKTVTSLTIAGAASVVEALTTSAYTVTAVSYDNGSTSPVPAVSWSVTPGTGTATVNASTGVVTGGTPGTVTVQATHVASGVVSNSVVLTVQAKTLTAMTIGGAASVVEGLSTAAFSVASASYNNGTSTPIPTVSWSVTAGTGTASINASTGVLTGSTPGTVTVTATHAATGVTASQGVTVLAKSVTALTIAGASSVLEGTNTTAYGVTAVSYDNGTTTPIPTVIWSVTNGTGSATVNSSTGVVTGGTPGTVTVRASEPVSGTFSNGVTLTVTAKTLTSMTIGGDTSVLQGNATAAYTVSAASYDNGSSTPLPTVTWGVSNGTGSATIDPSTGVVTGVSAGTVTVKATHAASGVVSNTITLTVVARTVTSITISGAASVYAGNSTAAYTVTAVTYNNGDTAPIPPVTWSLANGTGTATINAASGVVTSFSAGTVFVKATHAASGVISNTITLTVLAKTLLSIAINQGNTSTALGVNPAFTATGTYNDASTADVTYTTTWSSGTPAVATIGSNTGLVTTIAQGTTNITATSGVVSSPSVTLTVTAAVLASIAVTPSPVINPIAGLTRQFTATGTRTDGTTAGNITNSVTWTSSNTAAATLSSTGLATFVATGTTTITASAGSAVSPGVTLTVTPAALQSIAVTPASPANLPVGQTQAFTATGTLTDASTVDLTNSVTWASSSITVASIAASGVATGAGVGSSNITARDVASGITSPIVALPVVAPALVSIKVTAAGGVTTLPKGASVQLTATGSYSDGSKAAITSSVTWVYLGTDISIGAGGLLTGLVVNATPTAIAAALSGISSDASGGSISMQVVNTGLVSIAVTPTAGSIAVGKTLSYAAIGTFSNGTTATITGSVTWASSASGVATVSAAGVATGVAAGSATLSATDAATGISSTQPGGTSSTLTVTTSATNQGSAGSPLAITPPYSGQVASGSSYYVISGLLPGRYYTVNQLWQDFEVYMELYSSAAFTTRICLSHNFQDVTANESCVAPADGLGKIYVKIVKNGAGTSATYDIGIVGPIISPYWIETYANAYNGAHNGSTTRADTVVEVFSENDTTNRIGYNDDGGSEVATLMSGLILDLTPGATYYIKVTYYSTDDGGYTLWVNNMGFGGGIKTGNPALGVNEPNDTPAAATLLTLNNKSDNVLRSTTPDTVDWFKITLP